MNICFFGFSSMDYKGEEINEPVFMKKMVDSLENKNNKTYYLYTQGGLGLNEKDVYNLLQLKSTRLCIDKYTDYSHREYNLYTPDELYNIIEFNHKLAYITKNKDIKMELAHSVVKSLENLKEYDEKYNFDLFVFFGNSLYSNIIREYCKKNSKKYFNMENGYFRPHTLMVDSLGVNFESSIPRDYTFYTNIKVNKQRMNQFLHKPEQAIINSQETHYERKKYYKHYNIEITPREKEVKTEKNLSVTSDEWIYNEEYIYVPFQLETDSQIIKHSKNIKTMKQLVEITADALTVYNKENDKNVKIVYKTHPLYMSESEIIDLAGIQEICDANPNLTFLTEGNNKKLVENAKAVITINSTVGLEALLAYKPVIVLGQAFYGIEKISYSCADISELPSLITAALTTSVNDEYIDKFIYYLRFDYFAEIYRSYPDDASVENLIDRMLSS